MENSGQLAWGKPKVSYAKLTDGNPGEYNQLPTPIEGTTTITFSDGTERPATLEGGETYAVYRTKGTATFTADYLIAGKDDISKWFGGITEGNVADEYSIKIEPEFAGAKVVTINRASINLKPEYSANGNGLILHVVGSILKPATGDRVTLGTESGVGA